MNKIDESIVTIDIGTSKVGLIVTKVNKFNKLEVVHVETKNCDAIKKGEIVEPYKIADILKNSIAQIESRYALKIKSAYVNISNRDIIIDEIVESIDIDEGLGTVQKYDIDKLFNKIKDRNVAPDQKIIDILPIEYYDDNNLIVLQPCNYKTKKLRVKCQIIIADRQYIEKVEMIFQYARINLDGVIMQSYANAKLILNEDQKQKGTLLVDVGGTNIDLSLYLNNRLIYFENLEFGGYNITSDLSIGLDTTIAEAEKVKKQYSLAIKKFIENDYQISVLDKQSKVKKVKCSEVVEIIEARCEEIIQLINNKLEEIDAKQYIKEIVFIGQGFNNISKIDILANQILDREISLVNFKQTTQIKPVNLTAYSMQEYVLNNNGVINSKVSNVEEVDLQEKKGIFSKIIEKIKDFLYT